MARRQAGLHVLFASRASGVIVVLAALVASAAGSARAETPAPPPGSKPSGAIVIQESNGFPGGEKTNKKAVQKVTIVDGRLRVLDEENRWALFVSIDDKKVQEVSVDSREFVERDFAFYGKYRDGRARAIQAQAEEYVRERSRLQEAGGKEAQLRALDQEYTREGGDPANPGKIVGKFQQIPQDTRKATILVDGVPTEVTLEHVLIRENQAARPVFDLWVTKDVTLPINVFAFWNAIGTFSPEITARVLELKGTVIECKAVLDTGTFNRTFESKVLEVRTKDPGLTLADVTLPAERFTKVVAKDVQGPAAPDVPEEGISVVTGKPVDVEGALRWQHPKTGRSYWVADAAERRQADELMKKGSLPFENDPRSHYPGGR